MYNAFLADLHLHTTASDGTAPPREMVARAAEAGMAVIAVTDHDTVDGVPEALKAGQELGIKVIPGIELTTGGQEEIHILGYGMCPEHPAMHSFLESQLLERRERMFAILRLLSSLGIEIPAGETGKHDNRFMGRMNLARALVARGHCQTTRDAFDRHLNPGKPAYVPRQHINTSEGVALLKSFGAVVVLAHPGRLRMDAQTLAARLDGWAEAGLSGLEAYHSSHRESDMLRYDRLARGRGLLVTGGSDCHGDHAEGVRIGQTAHVWRTAKTDVETLVSFMSQTR